MDSENQFSDRIVNKNYPMFGRLHFVKDPYGILQMSGIVIYWIYGVGTTLSIILLPRYHDERVSGVFITVFLSIAVLCLSSLFRASLLNPGCVPINVDNVKADELRWMHCRVCMRRKPHRAHHCRRCKQCVLRMDHHCPWINNCVGEENHYAFFLLIFYAWLLSGVTFICCMLHYYVYPQCVACDKEVFYVKHSIWFMYSLTAMSALMGAFMSMQLITQHINLVMDKTTIENFLEGPVRGNQLFSFRSTYIAYRELFGSPWMIVWWFPCRKRPSTPIYKYTSNPV